MFVKIPFLVLLCQLLVLVVREHRMQEYLKYRAYQMNMVFYRNKMQTKIFLRPLPHY